MDWQNPKSKKPERLQLWHGFMEKMEYERGLKHAAELSGPSETKIDGRVWDLWGLYQSGARAAKSIPFIDTYW